MSLNILSETKPEIVWLAQNNRIQEFKAYLDKHPEEINLQGSGGLTALHWAASNRCLAICDVILRRRKFKADLWIKDARGRQAIHHAIDSGSKKIFDKLKVRMYDLT